MGEELPHEQNDMQPTAEEHQERLSEGDSQLGGIAITAEDTTVPDSYVRDMDKSVVMAHAENEAFDAAKEFPQNAAVNAGVEFDMAIAKSKSRGYEPNKAEKEKSLRDVERYNLVKRNQVLRYSDAIVERYKQTGDTPSPALEALAAVHKLVDDSGIEDFELEAYHGFNEPHSVRITFDKYENVIVETGDDREDKQETFTLSMFHGSDYRVTEAQSGGHGDDFDEIITTKRSRLGHDGVLRLKEILVPAITIRDEQRRLDSESQQDEEDYEEQREDNPVSDSFAHQAGWSESYK